LLKKLPTLSFAASFIDRKAEIKIKAPILLRLAIYVAGPEPRDLPNTKIFFLFTPLKN